LPKKVKRETPHMHDGSGASDQILYTGKFEVEWQLKSPLLLPENAEEEGWMRVVKENTAEITVPGSSVKGAMRSLHEAMFMGCMAGLLRKYIVKNPSYIKILGFTLTVNIIGKMLWTTYWLSVLMEIPFMGMLPIRVGVYTIIPALEAAVIFGLVSNVAFKRIVLRGE